MAKRSSIRTHPDPQEKIAPPGMVLLNAPFRILSLPHPIFCGYSTTSLRKLSASLRRASDADTARDAVRPRPFGTRSYKKSRNNAQKGRKMGRKCDLK